jgi:hypothetical protein
MKRLVLALVVLLASSGCGENSEPSEGSDASTADGGCAPRLAVQFAPTWRAPRAVPHACTDAQIETSLTLCDGASTNAGKCNAWNRDPSNAACRACLFTTEDEASYGAIVVLKNRLRRANVAGCLALADGNLNSTGCGVHLQALDACRDTACLAPCADPADFLACGRQAAVGICSSYGDPTSCANSAIYSPCFEPVTYEDFFRTLGKIFCGDGFPDRGDGGTGADAGALPFRGNVSLPQSSERAWADHQSAASGGPIVGR